MAINCHPIFIFCQSVCATRLIPHTKRLWHAAHSHAQKRKKGNVRICRDMHAGTLSGKDRKRSDRVNGKRHKGEAWLIWWLPEHVSLFNLSIIFDCVCSVLREFKRDTFGTGVSDQRMSPAMRYGTVTTSLSERNGSGDGETRNHGLLVKGITGAEMITEVSS